MVSPPGVTAARRKPRLELALIGVEPVQRAFARMRVLDPKTPPRHAACGVFNSE